MRRKVLNYPCSKKENLPVRKTTGENSRKPLSDRSNLVNRNSIVKKYEQNNFNNMWSTSEDCKGENNPSTEGSNVNMRWTITSSPSKFRETMNNLPSPIVYLENTSSDELTKHTSIICSCVCLEKMPSKELSKHFKQCNVILSDVLHDVEKNNFEKQNCDNENNINEVHTERKRFNLRKHKRIDYAQMHRGSSLLTEEVSGHIPVYNKENIREHNDKDKDVYNFDLEIMKMKRTARLNSSTPYDKDTENIMHKIEEKEKKQLKRRKRMPNEAKKNKIEKTKSPAVYNTVLNQFITKRKVNDINNRLGIKGTSTPLQNNTIPTSNSFSDEDADRDNDTNLSDFDAAPLELEICSNDQLVSINIANKVPDYHINILQNVDLRKLMNDNSNNENSNLKKLDPPGQPNTRNLTSQANISMDSFDKLLAQDEAESFNFDTVEPLDQNNSTPWRADLHVKRNPFFLQYKQTLLPSYNQDMVIDSKCEEKTLPGNKTPRNYPHSDSKQTSILSYVSGKSIRDSPDIIESSLYDAHELSPIKSLNKSGRKSTRNSSNKENVSLTSTPNKHNGIIKAKRQILGERSSNLENISSSPKKTSSNSNENSDELSYFGFNETTDKENGVQKPRKSTWLFGKPMRLEDYLMMAKTSKDKGIKQKLNESHNQESIGMESSEEQSNKEDAQVNGVTDEELPNMGLFEDLEPMTKSVGII